MRALFLRVYGCECACVVMCGFAWLMSLHVYMYVCVCFFCVFVCISPCLRAVVAGDDGRLAVPQHGATQWPELSSFCHISDRWCFLFVFSWFCRLFGMSFVGRLLLSRRKGSASVLHSHVGSHFCDPAGYMSPQ